MSRGESELELQLKSLKSDRPPRGQKRRHLLFERLAKAAVKPWAFAPQGTGPLVQSAPCGIYRVSPHAYTHNCRCYYILKMKCALINTDLINIQSGYTLLGDALYKHAITLASDPGAKYVAVDKATSLGFRRSPSRGGRTGRSTTVSADRAVL